MKCVSWTVCQTLKSRLFIRFLITVLSKERFPYDLEKWFRNVLVVCFIAHWMKRSKHGLFVSGQRKPKYGEGIVQFANRVAV